METVGIVQNIRSGAWLFGLKDNAITPDSKFTCMHCASLAEGCRLAYEEDVAAGSINLIVQQSVAAGFRNSVLFYRETPTDVKMYLKELGNMMNSEATNTTFLEDIRICPTIETSWLQLKTGKQ